MCELNIVGLVCLKIAKDFYCLEACLDRVIFTGIKYL